MLTKYSIGLIVFCCSLFGLDDSSHPSLRTTIVLDVDIISQQDAGTSLSYCDALKHLRKFRLTDSLSMYKNCDTIRQKGQEISKNTNGATNVTKQLFDGEGYKFSQQQIESLTALGVEPKLNEGSKDLLELLKENNFSTLLATHYDPYHYITYDNVLKKEDFNLQEYISGAVLIPGPYQYDKTNIPYFVADKDRPSYEYFDGILKQADEGKAVILFDSCNDRTKKQQRLIKKADDRKYQRITVCHAKNRESVETILKKLGYLK